MSLSDDLQRPGERAVDVIRRMNPGKDIPTGAELAARLRGEKARQIVVCPHCSQAVWGQPTREKYEFLLQQHTSQTGGHCDGSGKKIMIEPSPIPG